LILAQTGRMPGPERGTFAEIKEWVETTCDKKLRPADPEDGYGSMQVHNHDARQTLFVINHWREGTHADIGIGNQPKDNPDWTFAGNAGGFRAMRLRVLVHYR
jgi:sialate O-acetylesterase